MPCQSNATIGVLLWWLEVSEALVAATDCDTRYLGDAAVTAHSGL